MINDEFLCDIMDMDQGQRLNSGAGIKENFVLIEEESLNEFLFVYSSSFFNFEQIFKKEFFFKGICLNGEVFIDSFEGIFVLECQNGRVFEVVFLFDGGEKFSFE